MKVSISRTEEMSDDQRVVLARSLDGEKARKRKATREEARDFIWQHGADWEIALSDLGREESDEAPAEDEDEDLLGDTAEDEDLI